MTLMTDTAPTTPRRPHFRRHNPQPFVVQNDDIAIARFVHDGRFRRSPDIVQHINHLHRLAGQPPRPAKKIIERLGVLYHNQLPNPWKWKAKVPTPRGTMIDTANVPDAVFGLDFPEKRTRFYYMLEADRATMPVYRTTFSKTSLYGKYLTYYLAHKAGFHTKTYNITNFR